MTRLNANETKVLYDTNGLHRSAVLYGLKNINETRQPIWLYSQAFIRQLSKTRIDRNLWDTKTKSEHPCNQQQVTFSEVPNFFPAPHSRNFFYLSSTARAMWGRQPEPGRPSRRASSAFTAISNQLRTSQPTTSFTFASCADKRTSLVELFEFVYIIFSASVFEYSVPNGSNSWCEWEHTTFIVRNLCAFVFILTFDVCLSGVGTLVKSRVSVYKNGSSEGRSIVVYVWWCLWSGGTRLREVSKILYS